MAVAKPRFGSSFRSWLLTRTTSGTARRQNQTRFGMGPRAPTAACFHLHEHTETAEPIDRGSEHMGPNLGKGPSGKSIGVPTMWRPSLSQVLAQGQDPISICPCFGNRTQVSCEA